MSRDENKNKFKFKLAPLGFEAGRAWTIVVVESYLLLIGNIVNCVTRPSQIPGSEWAPLFWLLWLERLLLIFYALPLAWRYRRVFNFSFKNPIGKIMLGFAVGLAASSLNFAFNYLTYSQTLLAEMWDTAVFYPQYFLITFAIALVVGGFTEELMIRSILWGALRSVRLSDKKILFIQAAFFALSHAFNLRYGWYLWFFFIFIYGLIWGLITLRTKSILPAVIGHAVANVIGTASHGIAIQLT